MPGLLANIRSSDSINFEHTAALRNVEELTFAEKECVSPKEEPPLSERPAASFSFSFPGARPTWPSIASLRTSHSNSKASATSNVSEKIVVFRDEGRKQAVACSADAQAKSVAVLHKNRSKFHGALSTNDAVKLPPAAHLEQEAAEPYDAICDTQHTSNTSNAQSTYQLLQQLQSLAARRSDLLQQLGEIQSEEKAMLAQLEHSISAVPAVFSSAPAPNARSFTARRPMETPILLRPTCSPSRMPLAQPPKTSRGPSQTRTVSAPSVSTPSALRHRTPSASKRMPLSNKTEKLVLPEQLAHMQQSPLRTLPDRHERGDVNLESKIGTSQQTRTLRLPTKFGDDIDQSSVYVSAPRLIPGTPRHRGRAEGASSTRGRVVSKSRGKSRGRTPGTPAATPGIERSYRVPSTVARKKWDF